MEDTQDFEQRVLADDVSREDVLSRIWALLAEGVSDVQSPFHIPVVATVDPQGAPQARIVVLRKFDPVRRIVGFSTDARSSKIVDLTDTSSVSVVFYDPATRTQIRAQGRSQVHRNDQTAQEAWQAASEMARRCYRCSPGPGTAVASPTSGLPPEALLSSINDTDIASGYENFAFVETLVERLDWLYLTSDGNRAARFEWDADGKLESSWRIP